MSGNEHTVLLCRTGEVFTAGYNDNGQCGQGATQRVGVLTCVPNLAGRRAVQVYRSVTFLGNGAIRSYHTLGFSMHSTIHTDLKTIIRTKSRNYGEG